jgi:hypothetical protein
MKQTTDRRRRVAAALILGLLVSFGVAVAQDRGVALKQDDIRAEPFTDARALGALAKGDPVTILGREGGWLKVKAPKATGWVRMLSVRRGEAAAAGADVGGAVALATGRAGTGQIVSTTGVRGLDEAQLKGARHDEAALKQAESYVVSRKDARRFATQGKLAAREVEFLGDPRTVAPRATEGRP